MASHHQPHAHPQPHCQCHPTPTTSTICYCCYCCPNYTPSPHYPPLPDPNLLPHHHHPPPQTTFYTPSPYSHAPNPPCTNQNIHYHHHQQPQYHPPSTYFEKEIHFQQQLTHTHPLVSSLLRRITALESSLRSRHSASHSHSLRDAAARTIQAHFRAFLVRRSRTLRQLKDLASIKSTFNLLKSSVSKNPHFDPKSLSRKAINLLLKLDSIQGGDPMVRDGKKSIIRELNGFMDLIDEFILKRSEISSRLAKKNNVTKKSRGFCSGTNDLGKNKRLEELVHRIDALYTKVPREEEDLECPGISVIERNAVSANRTGPLGKRQDGVETNVKKSVRFVENGKVYEVRRSRDYDSDDGSDSIGAKGEFEEDVERKVDGVGGLSLKETVEDHSQDGESSKSSDGEGGQMYELRGEDGSFTFSAPLPVKMETRNDVINKRKTVKIVE